MATLYQRAGRHPEAVEAYSRAVRLNPQQGRWWLGLAISLEAAQNHGAAADAYQRAVQSGGLDSASRQYAQQRLVLLKNR
jgi:MSHA biogenesis protein MshN